MNIDTKELTGLVNKMGFPIVVAFGLMWFGYTVYQDGMAREQRMSDRIDRFDEALRDFSETLQSINTRLEIIEGKIP